MKKQDLEKLLIKKGYYRLEDVEAKKDIWLLYDWCKSIEIPFNATSIDIYNSYLELVENRLSILQRRYNNLPYGFTYAEKLQLEYAELLSE